MKRNIILGLLFVLFTVPAFAQKYAYIDSEYILGNIPEYNSAQAELDRIATIWQREIEAKFQSIDSMYKVYQVEAITLPENLKKKREEAIISAEQDAKNLQKRRFGKDGDLFKKREELVKPIQDRVFAAIEEYARDKGYAFVFDVAGAMTIVYADQKFDINDQILEKLGISPK
ncbi:MAG TPA: OmpH family outer membrane protein [Bacteroidales bacterium]|nr:OmpH family outer membrane protein [Bacteroidales bacterium]HOH22102.1 OmpH family outer membrane protein [Bacteroidales bacterium]HPB57064.1 OmpH family outer membrane protein [Bacteroidales bacterium]HPZ03437.1 OmpH family outer membrane protein [Bacteroidales bacterium]HQB74784.1 OmpH family outer membrane protein [Bacteroidales bacterium]